MAVISLTVALGGLLALFTWAARRRQRWLLATVERVVLPGVVSAALGNQRDVVVHLPPGYRRRDSGESRYDVLYLNDGQQAEALGLRETLARLSVAGRIRPVVAVAIPTNDDRLHEYGTAVAASSRGLGSLASAYRHFVLDELMPCIEVEFRTLPRAVFLGVSLGGLSAFDIAWSCPERFRAVGVMSGSLWWRAADNERRITPGRRIAHSLVRAAARPPDLRFWFQAGTRDEVCDRDGNGIIDAIQDTTELIDELLAAGLPREDVAYVQIDGGRHDDETWARVLPDFLQWAFTPGPAPRKAAPSSASRPPR